MLLLFVWFRMRWVLLLKIVLTFFCFTVQFYTAPTAIRVLIKAGDDYVKVRQLSDARTALVACPCEFGLDSCCYMLFGIP